LGSDYLPRDRDEVTLTVTAWSSGAVVGTRRLRISSLHDVTRRYLSVDLAE
jgi:hypothetical protein